MAGVPERIAHFVIQDQLGRGGMGVVYRAIDEKLGREVAIKVLAPYAKGDAEARARMLREARAAAGLTHRHIVTVYEIGDDGDHFYIAMEMIEGRSLRALLKDRTDPLPWREAVGIARAIASALAKAHAAGVVHRDLKPDNVLIARDGEVKLVDFGVAKLIARKPVDPSSAEAGTDIDTLTASGSWVGTPGYMAPESFGESDIDGRADLFALGALLYELITKKRAFRGDSPPDTIRKILLEDPPAPRTLVPQIPPALDALVMRCLAKSPSRRIGSADELLSELDQVGDAGLGTLSAASVSAPERPSTPSPEPTPSPTSTATMKRRLRWVAGVLAALLAVAIAVGVMRWRTPSAARARAPAEPADARAPSPFTDMSPVASCNDAARREYREAMRVLHDMGSRVAEEHFRAAAAADSQCAVVQLRAALCEHPDSKRREAFQRALSMRAALPPREAALAEAYVPQIAKEPSDLAATARALVALADARPDDAELQVIASYDAPDVPTARRLAERARTIDPAFADVWDALVQVAMHADDPKAARAALDACATHAPAATGCKETSLELLWRMNDCKRLETEARQFNLQADESFTSGYTEIAFARATTDPASPLVAEAIDQWERRMNKPHLFVAETWRVGRKVLLGDFRGADADLRELSGRVKAETDLDPHVRVGGLELELLVERGDDAAATRFASDFLSRQQAWNRPVRTSGRISSLEARMRSLVAASAPHAGKDRDAWRKVLASLQTSPEVEWAYGTAMFVNDAAEAREAMKNVPPTRAIPYDASQVELLIGRTALLAGDTKAATLHLERAAHHCDALYNPFQHVRAWLWLGKAREAAHDDTGACAAHRAVLERWGKANERSVTADEARAHMKTLGCD